MHLSGVQITLRPVAGNCRRKLSQELNGEKGKMKTGPLIQIFVITATSLLITACASNSGGGRGSASMVSESNPVCVGQADCQVKMAAARNWVVNTTGFGLRIDSDDLIETGGWGVADFTSVRVSRSPLGSNRYWLVLEIACGTDRNGNGYRELGCPNPTAAAGDFSGTVSAAH